MRFLMLIIAVLMLLPNVFSAEELLNCEWGGTSYDVNELLFFANSEYSNIVGPSFGDVLSSPISFNLGGGYDNPLTCTSPLNKPGDSLNFYESTDPSCSGDQALLHFTDDNNAMAALEYDSTQHNYTLCAELPTTISSVDIIVSNEDRFGDVGYSCLFRVSGEESGRISSCDAEFNSGNKYEYTVWARAFQSLSSLSCNSQCASDIDNRVRYACSQKLEACEFVPPTCDGSLVGSWVNHNGTHQIKCSQDWNEFRENPSILGSNIEVESNPLSCPNLIAQDYSVILDNEPVVMKIFMCSD